MTKEEIQEILDRNPIEGVIRKHARLVLLEPDGAGFHATCPFCGEPETFCVNPDRNIFHCFGCHRGGDSFTFLREMKSLSFLEAVNLLK